MGAAGSGVPDEASQEVWLATTKEQAAGAKEWFVSRGDGVVSASTIREVSIGPDVTARQVYRVKVSCNASSGVGEMQLTWSPRPQTGRTMTATADGNAPVEYRIEGKESMGNGGTVQSGHASVLLSDGAKLGFPNHSLTVRELFPGETVKFPFSDLDQKTRTELSTCFSRR
jgi:hypothetical protein